MTRPRLAVRQGDWSLPELQAQLESISVLSIDFIVMLVGSTVIATLGLFQNSPAVIIGAMIIAPLMRPLMGLSLAILSADILLLKRSLITLTVGTICGATISAMMGMLLNSITLTPEILVRTHPNLIDLGIAVFAGGIGAYCHTRKNLSDTIAGVAVAVALVPPLSVVGIGLSTLNWSVCSGAALLYFTNLVGITFAGVLVYFLMGYTALKQAKSGLMISAGAVLLLIIPLGLGMRELLLENMLSNQIKAILKEKTQTFQGVQLQTVEVRRFRKPMMVTATVIGTERSITPRQVHLVENFLSQQVNMPIAFRLRIIPSTTLSSDMVAEPNIQK